MMDESLFDRYPLRRRLHRLHQVPDAPRTSSSTTAPSWSSSTRPTPPSPTAAAADRARTPAPRPAARPRRGPRPAPDPGHRHPALRQGARASATCIGLLDPDLADRRPRRSRRAGSSWPGTSCSAAAPTSAASSTRTPPSRRTGETQEAPYDAQPRVPAPCSTRSSTTPGSRSATPSDGSRAPAGALVVRARPAAGPGLLPARRRRHPAHPRRRRRSRRRRARPTRSAAPRVLDTADDEALESADATPGADSDPDDADGLHQRRTAAGCSRWPARPRRSSGPKPTASSPRSPPRSRRCSPTATTRSCSAGSSTPPSTSPNTSPARWAANVDGRRRHRHPAPGRAGARASRDLTATDGPARAGRHRLPVRGRQPAGAVPGRRPLRPRLEPHPPRAARGPRRPVRPDRRTSSARSPSTAPTTSIDGIVLDVLHPPAPGHPQGHRRLGAGPRRVRQRRRGADGGPDPARPGHADQLALDLGLAEKHRRPCTAPGSPRPSSEKAVPHQVRPGRHPPRRGRPEVAAVRAALGDHAEVETFTARGPARPRSPRHPQRATASPPSPPPCRRAPRRATRRPRRAAAVPPAAPGHRAGTPSSPAPTPPSRPSPGYVLDAALDPQLDRRRARPARRAGVMRTTAVTTRTTLLLARFRFHLDLPAPRRAPQLVAEDARIVAFRGTPDDPDLARPGRRSTTLLATQPDANVPADQATDADRPGSSTACPRCTPHLDDTADASPADLLRQPPPGPSRRRRRPPRPRRQRAEARRHPRRLPLPARRTGRARMSAGFTTVRTVGAAAAARPARPRHRRRPSPRRADLRRLPPRRPARPHARPPTGPGPTCTGVWAAFTATLGQARRTATRRRADPREVAAAAASASSATAASPPPRPAACAVGDRPFPVSHLWAHVPIHLLGWGVDLDRRTKGVAGAAERAPHAMVQELLNRTDDYLWAVLSNGRMLRLLRDSTIAGRPVLRRVRPRGDVRRRGLHRLRRCCTCCCHQSRVEVLHRGRTRASDCWLERWRTARHRVRHPRPRTCCATACSRPSRPSAPGFLQHPGNADLRTGDSPTATLTLRGLPPRPAATGLPAAVPVRRRGPRRPARTRRRRASPRTATPTTSPPPGSAGSPAAGAAPGTPTCGRRLGSSSTASAGEDGLPRARPARPRRPLRPRARSTSLTDRRRCPTTPCSTAVRHLAVVQPKGAAEARRRLPQPRRRGARPHLRVPARTRAPRTTRRAHVHPGDLAGNERKTTGSYYTPTSLIDLVLDEALDPLLDEAEQHRRPRGRAPRPDRLRPGLRLRPLPRRRRPPHRRAARHRPHRRRPTPPRPTSRTRSATSSAAASTASTSTRWPPSSPRSACGSRRSSPAARSPSSTPTSRSATPCSAPPPRSSPTASPTTPSTPLDGRRQEASSPALQAAQQARARPGPRRASSTSPRPPSATPTSAAALAERAAASGDEPRRRPRGQAPVCRLPRPPPSLAPRAAPRRRLVRRLRPAQDRGRRRRSRPAP